MKNECPRMRRCFPEPPVVAYKRSKSLRDLLIRANFPILRRSRRQKKGFNLCQKVCLLCRYADETAKHSCKKTKETWDITSRVNCQTENVIYKIGCRVKNCKFEYIGETKRRFRERVTEHRGYVTNKKLDQPTGEHFNTKGHSLADMLPVIIEQVLPKENVHLRKRREKHWINKYQAADNGANKRS